MSNTFNIHIIPFCVICDFEAIFYILKSLHYFVFHFTIYLSYIYLIIHLYIFCIGLFFSDTPVMPEKSFKFLSKTLILLYHISCHIPLRNCIIYINFYLSIFIRHNILLLISNVIPARSSKLSISSSFVITIVPVFSCAEAMLLFALIGKIHIATTKPNVTIFLKFLLIIYLLLFCFSAFSAFHKIFSFVNNFYLSQSFHQNLALFYIFPVLIVICIANMSYNIPQNYTSSHN